MRTSSETDQGDEVQAPDKITAIASRFRDDPRALVCTEVLLGAPILWVCRKGFIWQFGCGRDHSHEHVYEGSGDPCLALTIHDIVARDPSVGEIATLNDHHIAYRATTSEPWTPHDDLSLWWF
jgi:hypothetical protein